MIYFIEGMDNCLKDTLIQLIRANLSAQTQVLKFSSPPKEIKDVENWQKAHFKDMFDLLKLSLIHSGRNIILNRAHLGEFVYSPIYRGYEGKWIFQLENEFLNSCSNNTDKLKLFVLYDSNNHDLKKRDDGKSLSKANFEKFNIERERFILAFKKSNISSKKIFDLSNYKSDEKVDVNLISQSMIDF